MVERAINDPFLERFFARIPRELIPTFDDEQLFAIKRAFATEHRGDAHSVDLRLSLPLLWRRFYVVLVLGPEQRTRGRRRADRRSHPLATFGNLLIAAMLALMLLVAAVGTLYLVKSALGIDLLPDTSFGLWQQIKQQVGFWLGR